MGNLDSVIEDRDVAPVNMDFDPIPDGTYRAMVTGSDVVTTKNGDGLILKLTHSVDEGEFTGRKVFTNLNIKNQNIKAEQIARGQLSALAKACGKIGIPEDSSSLHDIPHMIKVKTEQSVGYEPKNVIKGFYPLSSKSGTIEAKPVKAADTAPVDDDTLPF